jgi:3-methyladenine DNA glycosylase AlkD
MRNQRVDKLSEAIVADICRAIEDVTGCHRPKPERRFHKHDKYLSYGLKTADFWKIMKAFRPRFLELVLKERLKLAAELLGEHIGELGHAGIHVLALSVEQLLPCHFTILDSAADDFASWSHVDHLCSDVIQPLLCSFRGETLSLLDDWNHSPNPLKRRASVVAFTRKVAESGQFTQEVLCLSDNLIWDKDDIVRKAVGWALKDNLRSAPQRVLSYIKDLRRRGVSSTVILYAIRDLTPAQRKTVLSVRNRSKQR